MATTSYMPVSGSCYSAIKDIGIVPENATPSVAESNTLRLTQAAAAAHHSGNFSFKGGKVGPILRPIFFEGQNFNFKGTPYLPQRHGFVAYGTAGYGSPMTEGHTTLRGTQTRFNRIDGENGGAVLRLGGVSNTIDGIQFFGRRYTEDGGGPGTGPSLGTRTPIGIEVEGNSAPPTGQHAIRNCTIAECDAGVVFNCGNYGPTGAGTFTRDESHADTCMFTNIWFHQCASAIKSRNIQAVTHNFNNIFMGGWGGSGIIDQAFLDISERVDFGGGVYSGGGGNIWVRGLLVAHSRTTLIKLGLPYSPFTSEINIQNFKLDRFLGSSEYFKMVTYPTEIPAGLEWLPGFSRWQIRVQGHIAYDSSGNDGPAPDFSHLFEVPDTLPMNNWMFDIHSPWDPLPGLIDVGSGPWKTPDPAVWQGA